MGFADEKPRSIISAWGKDKITLAEAVKCGDLIAIDSSNNWDLAEGSTPKLAMYVAGEDGAIGDKITVYAGAVIRGEGSSGFAAVAGEIGDLVYLSDTGGEYSTTAGTTPQPVGWISKTNEIRVEIFHALRVASAQDRGLTLNGVPYMQAGAYLDPVVNTETLQAFHELWVKMTSATGRGYALRANIEMTGLTSRTSQALRAELQLNHASGHAAAGGAGIHAAADLGAGNDGHAGLLAGLNAAIVAAAETRSLQGTYCALSCQTEFKAGNTMPATTSFIRCADAGDVKAPFFLDFGELVTGAAHSYVSGTHAGTTVGGVLRVRTPFGTGYIKLFSD